MEDIDRTTDIGFVFTLESIDSTRQQHLKEKNNIILCLKNLVLYVSFVIKY